MKEFKTVGGLWEISETTRLFGLTLLEGASIVAPAGKQVTLVYNGDNVPIVPGQYEGDVVLEVTDDLTYLNEKFRAAIVLQDGKYVPEKSAAAAAVGGGISGSEVRGVSITSREEAFTGIFASIPEGTETVLQDVTLHMTGNGANDFAGNGAAVNASGSGKLTINSSSITTIGAARGAIYAGEHVVLEVNDTKIRTKGGVLNADYEDTIKTTNPGVMRRVPWMLGLRGNCRATNLLDYANATYNRCDIRADGWGVMSTDGVKQCRMALNDSHVEINGTSGYGALSIGDCVVTYDHTTVQVPDYGMILMMGKAAGVIRNGAEVTSGRFGTMSNMNSGTLTVQNASITSGETTFLVRGCSTEFQVENAALTPGNGIILQIMDADDPGNPKGYYRDAQEPDTPIEGRDLTAAEKGTDVVACFADMTINGDFYNGSSNRSGDTGGENLLSGAPGGDFPAMPGGFPAPGGDFPAMPGGFPAPGGDMPAMPGGFPAPGGDFPAMPGGFPAPGGDFPAMPGGFPAPGGDMPAMPEGFSMPSFGGPSAKNMELSFNHVSLTGRITSSTSRHRVEEVNKACCEELGEVINTAAPAVNNGVIVSLNNQSSWTVTDVCYLNRLTFTGDTVIQNAAGRLPTLLVNGQEIPLVPGTYAGQLQLIP